MSVTSYIDAVAVCLPPALGSVLSSFDARTRSDLDTLVRFCVDARCPEHFKPHTDSWTSGQADLRRKLSVLEPSLGAKRAFEGDGAATTNGTNKKAKLIAQEDDDSDETPLYTIHSLSVSSPVRKKVDFVITKTSIRFVNPTNTNLEARVPMSRLKRAFVVSNTAKNKNKEQWTVMLLSSDTVEKKADASEQVQVVFNLDKAVPAGKEGLRTTSGSKAIATHAKGEDTLPIIQELLSHLQSHIVVLQADIDSKAFRACNGQPSVEAYRGAKEGLLCFLSGGILWANAKPCEFFALEDLTRDSDAPMLGGVKTVSATGRTLTVYVRRKLAVAEGEEADEDHGDEAEFAMIDGRENENINAWIRRYRNLFGKPKTKVASNGKDKAPEEVPEELDSDEDDSDFDVGSDSDGGEPSSESSDEDNNENDAETASENESDVGSGDEGEEDLDEAHHPLMRPGAMPKMSKAAMDVAARLVTDNLTGGDEDSEPEPEEDELE